MPNKYISIDGVATFVHHTGATTLPEVIPLRGTGAPVLCLHDAGGNGAEFRALLERIGRTHDAFAFDQPAHARSAGLDSLGSIERLAAFSQALGDKLGLETPVLLGHGMGAAIALQCSLDAPEFVRALILVGAGARFEVPSEKLEITRRVTEGKEARPFDRGVYAKSTSPEVMRAAFMQSVKTDPRATLGDYRALQGCTVGSRLGEISVPTLVVAGAEDACDAQGLATGISGARLVEIPDAGHAILHEQPDALFDGVLEFLEALSA